ncbi:MAG: lysophospholipase [Rhodothermia bacterium]|nr:lysophospholipase [Rhodothermia bacterium]
MSTPKTSWSEGIFQADDGASLYRQSWFPETQPRAVVIIVHGFAEHSGRYVRHAERLASHGFAVEAMDLRGHGKSSGKRGLVRSVERLIDDVSLFVNAVLGTGDHKNLPLFIWGHSLGATIAGLIGVQASSDIRGVVLCSPALRIGEPVFLQSAGMVAARILPMLPTKRLNRKLLYSDERLVLEANEDPLNFHGFIRVGTAAQIVLAGRQLLAAGSELVLPLLIVHGTEDRLTLAVASAKLYRSSRSQNKSLSLFKGMRHETFNEPDGHQVMDRIVDFFEELVLAQHNA